MDINYIFLFHLLFSVNTFAQTNPAITHWIIITGGQTGFGGITTNVQQIMV